MKLGLDEINISKDGLDNFYWPIDRRLHIETMRAVISCHEKFLSSEESDNPTSIELLHGHLIVQIASLLQAENLKACGERYFQVPNNAIYWRCVLLGQEVPLKMVSLLRSGLKLHPLKRRLRRLKPAFTMGGLHSCGLNKNYFKKNIITTAGINDLVKDYACVSEERVYVCPVHEWFPPASPTELEQIDVVSQGSKKVDRYIGLISATFEQYGVGLGQHSRKYLARWITETTKYVEHYCRRLASQPDLLPKRLWMNSIGIPWNSMLAYSTRQAGGDVTVFDHAYGANASLGSHTAFVELKHCDHFVTYSEEIKRLLESDQFNSSSNNLRPKVTALPNIGGATGRNRRFKKPKKAKTLTPKSIMYVQPLLLNDRSEIVPLMPDIVAADWQSRLLSMLSDKGYNIFVKPHPLSKNNLPTKFFHSIGANVLNENFEDVYDLADVILYDYTLSTTFSIGLQTDREVVLVDFGYSNLPRPFWDKLDKRVARVQGWFDEKNRAQVSWTSLQDAIDREVRGEINTDYVRDVLGSKI